MKSLLLLLILPAVLCEVSEWACEVNNRLLGGEYAEEGEFPGIVFLIGRKRHWNYTIAQLVQSEYTCAGSLISDHWVLTAAHCIAPDPPAVFHSISVYPTKGHPHSIESTKVIPHPGYWINYDDIALILLPQPISSIYPNFKPVSLPLQGQRLTSNEVTLVGWGVTSTTTDETPSKLMKLEHVQLNQNLCLRILRSANKLLCRYPTESTGATCHGDSGGPIFMDGLQVGVVSGGKRTFLFGNLIDRDTRVSAYRNWIDAQMRLYMS